MLEEQRLSTSAAGSKTLRALASPPEMGRPYLPWSESCRDGYRIPAGRGRAEEAAEPRSHEPQTVGFLRQAPMITLLGASLLTSCATVGRGRTTWEQDAADGIATRPSKRALPPAEPEMLEAEVPSFEPAVVADRLERALFEFGAARRARSAPSARAREEGGAKAWPHSERLLWQQLLSEIERAFVHPFGTLPSRILLQVRVVVEAERERLVAASGPPPLSLDRRIARAFVQVSRRLRSRRSVEDNPQHPPASLTLQWPVSPILLTSGFGYRRDPIYRDGRLGFHAGIDLAGADGDLVYSAAEGQVIASGPNGGLGKAVFVQHRGGYVTVYAHLSRTMVIPGTLVDPGTVIGLMGSTGRATGAHLHFEVRLGSTPLDPLELLRREPAAPALSGPAGPGARSPDISSGRSPLEGASAPTLGPSWEPTAKAPRQAWREAVLVTITDLARRQSE